MIGQKRVTEQQLETLLQAFVGSDVQSFVALAFAPGTPSLAVVEAPAQYSDVVDVGKQAVPALIDLLRHDEWTVRVAALMALTDITNQDFGRSEDFMGDPPAASAVARASIADWEEWWEKNQSKSQVEWLLNDLSEGDSVSKKRAIARLAKLEDPLAIPPLRQLLVENGTNFFAARALAKLHDGSAIPYLIDLYLQHDNVGYRREGIDALDSLTGERLGFEAEATRSSRDAAVRRWKDWWARNEERYAR